MKTPYIPSILRIVLTAIIIPVLCDGVLIANNQTDNTTRTVAPRPIQEKQLQELNRVSENGGEVLIDGSLRVFEPIYIKNIDLVEISTSVKPIVNHVRIYAVAVGTYTVIKVQFDDGQEKVLTNN
jgi:hypothetical protein